MLTVHRGVLAGLTVQVVLVGTLAGAAGVGAAGMVAGLIVGAGTAVLLSRALRRSGARVLGPANLVTLLRSVLVGGVAALVVDSVEGSGPVAPLIGLAVLALALDAVDGRVARRTGTVSAVGARFDMEVDSVLVLVLSAYVARSLGAWVLAIGSVHYVLEVARWALPWLRRPTPPRHWCKVVAAVQGIVLITAAAGVLPRPVAVLALLAVAALLVESFGREVAWLWRARRFPAEPPAEPPAVRGAGGGHGRWRTATTVLAFLFVWFVLVTPQRFDHVTPAAYLRIPVEGLALVGLALVVPPRRLRGLAVAAGSVLGVLAVVRILDMGFWEALHRPVNPVNDAGLLGPAVGVLQDSVGRGWADAAVAAAVLLAVAVPVAMTVSVVRVLRVARRHRGVAARSAGALGVLWLVCALLGVQLTPFAPMASRSAAELAVDQVGDAVANLRDRPVFAAQLAAADPYRAVPDEDLLSGLRGKDVIVAFVESYGRVAVQDPSIAPGVRAVLDAGTESLRAAGFSSRSAFLTSSTFGGTSWLAHGTLHSGLWTDSQQRYDQLLASDRLTLPAVFRRAGWRTVVDVPSNRDPWPEGRAFYRFDEDYDRHDVGYAGPKFSFAAMPDQYTLAAFQRRELAPGHAPVMAEIDLVTSHEPWTPLPRMVAWDEVGDGSVYRGMPAEGLTPADAFRDDGTVRALYGTSIEYSLSALVSFVTTFHRHDRNLVLVLLGDHQPGPVVSGPDAGHDVPITILAADPAVIDRVSAWGWDDGMRPGPQAPVWPMDAVRDRFLAAFGPLPSGTTTRAAGGPP
ncbi:MAG: CDP-alcohol phosphatidyltransferase [Blastococcus sp.]|nr:CDP-alcohol phosphatidyltransferase [Blastococcus sp.]